MSSSVTHAEPDHRRRPAVARSPWPLFMAVIAACWTVTIVLHLRHADLLHSASAELALVSWLAMTTAMMSPTAVPMLSTLRSMLAGRSAGVWWAFLGGYLLTWAGFAVGAATVQHRLGQVAVWDGDRRRMYAAAALLAVAGLYQFSSLKTRCLRACTNPMQWYLRNWRDGRVGAVKMGLRHGAACVGCCWALMALALVGGSAAFAVMLVTAALMIVEKTPGRGEKWAKPIGYGLIAAAVVLPLTASRADAQDHHHRNESSHVRPASNGDTRATLVTVR